jgi:DNA-binding response OmpR family regulator
MAMRVLLVDDQIEVRRMIRAGLETLGGDLQILDMPSAEEAMLEIVRTPIDLYILDIRLPGMSGLELLDKVYKRDPEAKVILITGLTDTKTKNAIASVSTYATFTKPIMMEEFLETVQRCLGQVKKRPKTQPLKEVPPKQAQTLGEWMEGLHKAVKARAIYILDSQGQVVAQTGVLPEQFNAQFLPSSVTAAISANALIARLLTVDRSQSLLQFFGKGFSFYCLSPIENQILVVLIETGIGEKDPHKISAVLDSAIPQLITLISTSGETVSPEFPETPTEQMQTEAVESVVPNIDVDALFEQKSEVQPDDVQLDEYWDKALEQSNANTVDNTDALTYDQARRLGLTPQEGES